MTRPLPLRIFVSSPGDLGEERALTARVIGRLSRRWEGRLRLEPYFWEREALPAPLSPQAGIASPADADIFLCLLGARLGTPLSTEFARPDGSRYASGTQYELEIAEAAWRSRRKPEVYVYRKTTLPSIPLNDPEYRQRRDQYEALQQFLESWTRDQEGSLVRTVLEFAQPAELETRLEEHLGGVLARLAKAEPLPAPIWLDGSPYRGLEVFGREHVAIFFGRTRAVSALLAAMREQAAAGTPFVMVLGMSGCGKSSLVRAGLLPLLTEPGVVEGVKLWRQTLFLPSQATGDLFDGLAAALLRQGALPELGSDPSLLARNLRESPDSAGLLATTALPPESRLALAIDQSEEIFTLASATPETRCRLVRALAALARTGRVWIVATLRSDFFARCEEIPELLPLLQGQGLFSIPPPTSAEIEQMIEGPAAAAGLRFQEPEDGGEHLQDILRDAVTGRPERLPLLEFTLDLLFEKRTSEGFLTRDAYDRLGGLEGAVATHAETIFGQLPPATRNSLASVLWLQVTARPEPGSPATSRRALSEDLPGPAAQALADAFVKARLLTSAKDDEGRPTLALAHESLLTHWPTAKAWLAENRRLLQIRARIEDDAAHWMQEGEREDLLIPPGRRLDEARELVAKAGGALFSDLVRYVRRSSDASQHDRWRNIAVALCILLLLVVISLSGLGVQRRVQAEKALEKAEGADDSHVALAWLAHAVRLDPGSTQARSTLIAALFQRSWPLPALQIRERPLVLSPERRYLATVDAEKRIRVWDLSTWKPIGTPFAIAMIDYLPALSRDGRRLLWQAISVSREGITEILRVYDTRQGRLIGEWSPKSPFTARSYSTLLSPRGDRVAIISESAVLLWELKANTTTLLTSVATSPWGSDWMFSPDGRWLIKSQDNGHLDLWDMDARPPRVSSLQPIQDQESVLWNFSPDGRLGFATPGQLGWINLPSGKLAAVERVSLGDLYNLLFDSDRLMVVNLEGAIVSRRATPSLQRLSYIQRQDDSIALGASRDGFWLMTRKRLWRTLDGAPVGEGLSHDRFGRTFLPSDPRVPRVLTLDEDRARTWAYAPPPVDRLPLPEDSAGGILVHGQNRLLTARRSALVLWDLQTRKPVVSIPAPGVFNSRALQDVSENGRFAVTCSDGVARVWDLERGVPVGVSFSCPDRPALYASSVELRERRPLVKLSPDGRWIGAAGGTIREVATGRPEIQEAPLWWIDFSGRDRVVLVRRGGTGTADRNESVVVRTLPEGRLVAGPWSVEGARLAIMSPTWKRIAVGGLLSMQLLEFPSGRVLFSAPLDSMVQSLAFDPQGRRCAVATRTNVHIRDAETGRLVGEPFTIPSVRSIQFSPDGQRLLITSSYSAQMLDVASGQQIGDPLKADEISDAGFSPDGQSIWASAPGAVYRWDRPLLAPSEAKKLTRLAEAIAGQSIDEEGRAVPLRDPIGLLNELRREAAEAPLGQPTAASLTRWLLRDWTTRPISPLSQVTPTEYVQHCIDQKTPEAWDAAERAFPGHPLLRRHPRPMPN